MLRRQDVPLGVRHEAEDAAAGVAQPGDVALRAVRVDGIRPRLAFVIDVLEYHLSGLPQPLQNPRLADEEPALAVGRRHVEPVVTLEEGTAAGDGPQVDPAVLELAGSVAGQGGE